MLRTSPHQLFPCARTSTTSSSSNTNPVNSHAFQIDFFLSFEKFQRGFGFKLSQTSKRKEKSTRGKRSKNPHAFRFTSLARPPPQPFPHPLPLSIPRPLNASKTARKKPHLYPSKELDGTYDHRLRKIGHPVRSAIHKPQIGRLVVGWVTTSEYLLLYVFFDFSFLREAGD